MKTIFGKELVKIRLENNISLKDMAAGLSVPSSYLSAVESASDNSKKVTSDFLERILGFLCLDEEQEIGLRNKATMSSGECLIDTSSLDEHKIDTLTMFARRVRDLPDGELEEIRKLLKKEG